MIRNLARGPKFSVERLIVENGRPASSPARKAAPKDWEESFDDAELTGGRVFCTDVDAFRMLTRIDAFAGAIRGAADVAFRPKCLGM